MNHRAAFEKMLLDRVDIYRPTPTVNAHHEKVAPETKIGTAVPCSVGISNDNTLLFSGGVDNKMTRPFLFAWNADVQERDRIVYLDRSYFARAVDPYKDYRTGEVHHLEVTGDTVIGG